MFRIDIYFSECSLAVEIDEKGHTDRDLIFEEKRQKALEKKLGCKFIRINTSNAKNGYDLDYNIGNIEAFIDELKNKKVKELEKEIREIRNEKGEMSNEKLKNKNKKFNKQLGYQNFSKIMKNWECKTWKIQNQK